ncbi:flagellar hook protein FlgE [Pontibaca salina]|uniref:Flagellar hook protein FlgE n=1 Tax=Pontibaca salina TaxID=2795731 RepID=A0A934HHX1_9RHOB|nr:flagellar hook-basal body complex protein [Pontibaca salina]MBI6628474.1 flagellar hook-basal body complex protein [Pontibaca salina]
MTISSSLHAGVAGLNVHASKMASISDNIANSSTFGYKRVQTDFHSMVAPSVGGAYIAGGVRASTQQLIDERSGIVSTANPTDLAVRGRGMLPVTQQSQIQAGSDKSQMLLTTTGSFRPNADGYLTTESGLALLGWPIKSDGTTPSYPRDTADGLEPVQININQLSGQPTTQIMLGINLPAAATEAVAGGNSQELPVEYFDNLGRAESIQVTFVPTVLANGPSNEWTMELRDSAAAGALIGEYTLSFNDNRINGGTLASVNAVSGGAYDPASGAVIVNVDSGPIEVSIGQIGERTGLTQLSASFAPVSISRDGSPVGNLISVEVDAMGYVRALFDTGLNRTIYKVPLVDMPNPNGMVALDYQTFIPSPESGSFFLWDAGDGPTGDIIGYAREESATDVASELTDMIQTQRAYSSNAKVIQTVDEMLQETANLKR